MENHKWQDVKLRGSGHYKKDPNKIEPIDLYKDGNMLMDFALCCIIKYAYRSRVEAQSKMIKADMEKIKHYADMVIAYEEEKDGLP
jgi:hypothetical protein